MTVHPDFEYVKIKDELTGNQYILLEKRLDALYKDPKKAKFTVLERYKGAEMKGWEFEPMFDYFVKEFKGRAYKVMVDSYVTDDSGTGIVQNAPAFGEDDYRVCLEHGVIDADGFLPCPLDEKGCFEPVVTDFAGMYIKVIITSLPRASTTQPSSIDNLSIGRRQGDSEAAQAKGSSDRPVPNYAQLSFLLAIGHAAHLPRGAFVVRPREARGR